MDQLPWFIDESNGYYSLVFQYRRFKLCLPWKGVGSEWESVKNLYHDKLKQETNKWIHVTPKCHGPITMD